MKNVETISLSDGNEFFLLQTRLDFVFHIFIPHQRTLTLSLQSCDGSKAAAPQDDGLISKENPHLQRRAGVRQDKFRDFSSLNINEICLRVCLFSPLIGEISQAVEKVRSEIGKNTENERKFSGRHFSRGKRIASIFEVFSRAIFIQFTKWNNFFNPPFSLSSPSLTSNF